MKNTWKLSCLLLLITFSTCTFSQCTRNVTTAKQSALQLAEFSAKMYNKIVPSKKDENVVFSPLSIALALTLVENGAGGQSQSELRSVLVPYNQSLDPMELYQSLSSILDSPTDGLINLTIANGLFHAHDITLNADYLSRIRCLSSQIQSLNFADQQSAVHQINSYIANATEYRIPQLLNEDQINAETKGVLANSIYMKAQWGRKFDVTQPMPFYRFGRDEEKQIVPYFQSIDQYAYVDESDFMAVQIPYDSNELGFYIFLPKQRDGIEEMERKLSGDKFVELTNKFEHKKLDLKIPRFTIRCKVQLVEVLKQLGINQVFTDNADLTGMTDQRLKIDRVSHETVIQVNENGTEAASATAASMVRPISIEPDETPIPFIVQYPFIFAIVHQHTKSIVFMGKVNFIEENNL